MKATKRIMKVLKNPFNTLSDQRIVDSINLRNIRNIYAFSLIVCILDTIFLLLFTAANWDKPGFRQTFFNVGWCVVACAVVTFLSKSMLKKYDESGTISSRRADVLVTFFYIIMSVWGIIVDLTHYSAGEQMLTFYIVQFCFLCFVVIKPWKGSLLIALSFSALFFGTYFINKAVNIQTQNFIIFTVIAIFGNRIQHMTLQQSEKSKIDILELNQVLQQEASVDDLTKLKNRKSLRGDFNKHTGSSVYVIMADVDNFKSYNDTYGHVTGDTVLRMVAFSTMEAFQDGDAYRFGGDEFLIILSDCAEGEFMEKIGRWKKALRSIQIPDATLSITCSFGYEHCFVSSTEDMRNAIKIADNRLYEAKNQKSATA